MSSYSDIIFLTAALFVFSSLTINTAKSFQTSSKQRYAADIEFRAIAVTQDEIDKIQWIYDESQLDPDSPSYIYSNSPKIVTTTYGSSNQYSEVFTIDVDSEIIENTSSQKRFKVTVSTINNSIKPAVTVTMDYIKTYSK